ncbi:ABC transporter ATP-binding protein [Celeribacter ethanolicus]|uniref:ABC transporter ATP-binding protein n=1 Tax=Celeribacter ethanolicus TaxID=1758178 RepID=UPI00082D88BE|nr:oligopeptide/dipeptide ABC transporter ATP-binding protein [Celeribacter ethanolicus]
MTDQSNRFATDHPVAPEMPILSVRGLGVTFDGERERPFGPPKKIQALENITFDLARGKTLGLVGESGSGKSTLGRAILRRLPISDGRVIFDGKDISNVKGEALRRLTRDIQLIFQDPYTSLNPRMKVLELIAEPLLVHGIVSSIEEARDQVGELMRLVNLPLDALDRFPHGFSGGQRQRIGIARALALKPRLIIADEPVSALDVSVRAQVVNLMQDLQQELGLTYVFIAHDLSVVRHISHDIAILHRGHMVEMADRDAIYEAPEHPYTKVLLSAVPEPDPALRRNGDCAPEAHRPPELNLAGPGCRYRDCCDKSGGHCQREAPPFARHGGGHWAACWHVSTD